MPADEFPSSWTDPGYVATVVMVVSTGMLFFYAVLTPGEPLPETVGFVILWLSLPATVAYELVRRLG